MRYIVRADASHANGSGHVMRSSALAEELISRGEVVIFIGMIVDIPWLIRRVHTLGFSQILTSPSDFISNPTTDVLILDSYILPVEETFIQKNNWRSVVTIVDEFTPEYKTDLMIYPSLSADLIQAKSAKILSGPRHIPLRKSIRKNQKHEVGSGNLEIIVVGGGTDSFNFVGAICEALLNIQDNFKARIFTSSCVSAQQDFRFEKIPIGSKLDYYASSADLVFTTAGTSSLEFIAREVAVGIGCAVDNQARYYEILSSSEVAMPVGRHDKESWRINQSIVAQLVRSKDLRRTLRQKCEGVIDLNGSARIVDEILKL